MYEHRENKPKVKVKLTENPNPNGGIQTYKISIELDEFNIHDVGYLEMCFGRFYAKMQDAKEFEPFMVHRLDHIKDIRDKYRIAITESKIYSTEEYRCYEDKD
jgi:hypothetical protein